MALSVTTIFACPFTRDHHFVPRQRIFDLIESKSQQKQPSVLIGLGGTGKSQIAIECAYRFQCEIWQNQQCSVLWIDAETNQSIVNSFSKIARDLRISNPDESQGNALQLVKDWLEEIGTNGEGRNWLLVLDNVETPAQLLLPLHEAGDQGTSTPNSCGKTLQDYLPRQSRITQVLLVTTRNADVAGVFGEEREWICVNELSAWESRTLLRTKLGQGHPDVWNGDDEAHVDENVDHLLTQLGHNPLAITQAATFVEQNQMTLASYLGILDGDDHYPADCLNSETMKVQGQTGWSNLIFRMWNLSFEGVKRTDPFAAEVLSVLAMLDGQQTQICDLANIFECNESDMTNAISSLMRYNLITLRTSSGSFSMHPLIQALLRSWLKQKGCLEQYVHQTLRAITKAFSDRDRDWEKCQTFMLHAERVLGLPEAENSQAQALLLYERADYQLERGLYVEALKDATQAYRQQSEQFGDEAQDTLQCQKLMAKVLMAQGEHGIAEKLCRQVVTISQRTLGFDAHLTLLSMNNLAIALRRQAKYEEAEEILRQVIAQEENIWGLGHPKTLTCISNLAIILRSQHEFEEAEELTRQALAIQMQTKGLEDPDTLTFMSNLGSVIAEQDRQDEAEKIHRQVLTARQKVLGAEHPSTILTLNNIAAALNDQGKCEEAETLHRQAIVQQQKSIGKEHPHTLVSMNNLAYALAAQQKYAEAESIHRQVLAGNTKVLGPEHEDTLTNLHSLATILQRQGKHEEAEDTIRQALEVNEMQRKPDHPDTLRNMSTLAKILASSGNHDNAEPIYRQVIAGRKKVLGTGHNLTIETMHNLVRSLTEQRKYTEALTLQRQILTQEEKVLGENATSTLISVWTLASLHYKADDNDEFKIIGRRALSGLEQSLGPDDSSTRAVREQILKIATIGEDNVLRMKSEMED